MSAIEQNLNKKIVCIIGEGRFGKYLRNLINSHSHEFYSFCIEKPDELVFSYTKIHMFVLAVPISKIGEVAEQYSNFFTDETTIVDISSIKEWSMEVLSNKNLKGHVIYTHPLFGPQSSPLSCKGERLVVCSPTTTEFDNLFFKDLGLIKIDSSAEEHDLEMAKSQLLNHVIGRAAKNMGITRTKFSTKTHDKFMDIVDIVNGNSEELYNDMMRFNRHTRSCIKELIKSIEKVS